jgi:excisionase family DNA binding protein
MLPDVNYFQQAKEALRLLSVSPSTVHNLIQSGELIASRMNAPSRRRTHVRITRASLQRYYAKRFGHPLKRAMENPFE